MFSLLTLAFNLPHSHMLPRFLVKAMSFSTGEHVHNEQLDKLPRADSKLGFIFFFFIAKNDHILYKKTENKFFQGAVIK